MSTKDIAYIISFLICVGFGLSLLPTDQEVINSISDLELAFMVIFTLSGSAAIGIGIVEIFYLLKNKIK